MLFSYSYERESGSGHDHWCYAVHNIYTRVNILLCGFSFMVSRHIPFPRTKSHWICDVHERAEGEWGLNKDEKVNEDWTRTKRWVMVEQEQKGEWGLSKDEKVSDGWARTKRWVRAEQGRKCE